MTHQWWYCWLLQLTGWTWEEGDMCLCPSVPHAWRDGPAHSWTEMWELKAYDWSISGCCRVHLIFSCKNKVLSLRIGFKNMQWCWTVCLRNDTWALKTGTSWRDWGHHRCCYRQNEALFAPAGSDDKDVLCPCAQNGDRCHWAWTVVKTMNKYNGRQTVETFFSVSRDFKQWLNGKYVIHLQTFQRTSCLYGQVTRSFAQGIGWCEKGSCCTWLWFGSWEGMPEIKPVNKTHSLVFSF